MWRRGRDGDDDAQHIYIYDIVSACVMRMRRPSAMHTLTSVVRPHITSDCAVPCHSRRPPHCVRLCSPPPCGTLGFRVGSGGKRCGSSSRHAIVVPRATMRARLRPPSTREVRPRLLTVRARPPSFDRAHAVWRPRCVHIASVCRACVCHRCAARWPQSPNSATAVARLRGRHMGAAGAEQEGSDSPPRARRHGLVRCRRCKARRTRIQETRRLLRRAGVSIAPPPPPPLGLSGDLRLLIERAR